MNCFKCNSIVSNALEALDGLRGDEFIQISCSSCSETAQVVYMRLSLSWADVVYLVLFHLTLTTNPDYCDDSGRNYYQKKMLVMIIEKYWSYLWDKSLDSSWKRNFLCHLSSDKIIQWSEKKFNCWALKEVLLPKDVLGLTGRRVVGQVFTQLRL